MFKFHFVTTGGGSELLRSQKMWSQIKIMFRQFILISDQIRGGSFLWSFYLNKISRSRSRSSKDQINIRSASRMWIKIMRRSRSKNWFFNNSDQDLDEFSKIKWYNYWILLHSPTTPPPTFTTSSARLSTSCRRPSRTPTSTGGSARSNCRSDSEDRFVKTVYV